MCTLGEKDCLSRFTLGIINLTRRNEDRKTLLFSVSRAPRFGTGLAIVGSGRNKETPTWWHAARTTGASHGDRRHCWPHWAGSRPQLQLCSRRADLFLGRASRSGALRRDDTHALHLHALLLPAACDDRVTGKSAHIHKERPLKDSND